MALPLPLASLPDTDSGSKSSAHPLTDPRTPPLLLQTHAAVCKPAPALSRDSSCDADSLSLQPASALCRLASLSKALGTKSMAPRNACTAAPRISALQTISIAAHSGTPLSAAGKSCIPSASAPVHPQPCAGQGTQCPRNPRVAPKSRTRTEIHPLRDRTPPAPALAPSSSRRR